MKRRDAFAALIGFGGGVVIGTVGGPPRPMLAATFVNPACPDCAAALPLDRWPQEPVTVDTRVPIRCPLCGWAGETVLVMRVTS